MLTVKIMNENGGNFGVKKQEGSMTLFLIIMAIWIVCGFIGIGWVNAKAPDDAEEYFFLLLILGPLYFAGNFGEWFYEKMNRKKEKKKSSPKYLGDKWYTRECWAGKAAVIRFIRESDGYEGEVAVCQRSAESLKERMKTANFIVGLANQHFDKIKKEKEEEEEKDKKEQ